MVNQWLFRYQFTNIFIGHNWYNQWVNIRSRDKTPDSNLTKQNNYFEFINWKICPDSLSGYPSFQPPAYGKQLFILTAIKIQQGNKHSFIIMFPPFTILKSYLSNFKRYILSSFSRGVSQKIQHIYLPSKQLCSNLFLLCSREKQVWALLVRASNIGKTIIFHGHQTPVFSTILIPSSIKRLFTKWLL